MALRILAEHNQNNITKIFDRLPIELGRSQSGLAGSPSTMRLEDVSVSRHHVRISSPHGDGLFVVENISQKNDIRFADGTVLQAFEERLVTEKTIAFEIGETRISIELVGDVGSVEEYRTISNELPANAGQSLIQTLRGQAGIQIVQIRLWLESILSLQRTAVGTEFFCERAAQAAVELIEFDYAQVLTLHDGQWTPRASFPIDDRSAAKPSRTMLQKIVSEKLTQIGSGMEIESVESSTAVTASPILGADESQVIGAIYGTHSVKSGHPAVDPDVAGQLLQILAGVVGLGMIRQKREIEAAKSRAKFEQFFTEKLARELEKNESLLEGRESEITVMFCDVRGSSSLNLVPRDHCRLMSDILECLTIAVRDYDGVVVDYAGDGMLAIWNAPSLQPDHADLAATAALQMQRDLPKVNQKWKNHTQAGIDLRVGIGIHTGVALVGNTGTTYKFQYGASGSTVNLASRIESSTKHVGVPIMLTAATRNHLSETFSTRRLLSIRVPGFDEAIEVYELHEPDADWQQMQASYERALALFERGQWAQSCQSIQKYLFENVEENTFDKPSLTLGRAKVALSGKIPMDSIDQFCFASKAENYDVLCSF